MPRISLDDCVQYLRANDALCGWSDVEIKHYISKCARNASLAYTTKDGKLNGICFGEWKEDATTFFVHCIVAPKQLKVFIEYLMKVFPRCKKIEGIRGENLTKIYHI